MQTVTFKSAFSPRRSPDPVNPSIEWYQLLCDVREMPTDLPLDANAREPNINRAKYRDIRASLLGTDGSVVPFHQKNKGITILVESANKDGDELHVTIPNDYGVTDGGHTLELIKEEQGNPELPERVYVPVTVRAGTPVDWVPEISGGLNTALQVKDMSLDNLAGRFDWLKKLLRDEPYYDQIAWRENEEGQVDAREIIAILNLFNVKRFGDDSSDQPVESYSKKGSVLSRFEQYPEEFQFLSPVIRDILRLHDIVRYESKTIYNAEGGKFGGLGIVESRKRDEYEALFTGGTSRLRLTTAALYPILASLRVFVGEEDGEAIWRGGFDRVREAWEANGADLIRIVHNQHAELGRNPNKLGKSKPVWEQCHQKVWIWSLRTAVS